MRKNNAHKELLLGAAGIVVVCIVVGLYFYVTRQGKSTFNNGTNQYTSMMADYSELDYAMYEDLSVLGEEVKKIIKDNESNTSIKIKVVTQQNISNQVGVSESTIETNSQNLYYKYYTGTPVFEERNSTNYINESASFRGAVTRNKNGLITIVTFTQQK